MRIIEFNDGVLEVFEAIRRSSSKPFVGALYGVPDSGKTYLTESAALPSRGGT